MVVATLLSRLIRLIGCPLESQVAFDLPRAFVQQQVFAPSRRSRAEASGQFRRIFFGRNDSAGFGIQLSGSSIRLVAVIIERSLRSPTDRARVACPVAGHRRGGIGVRGGPHPIPDNTAVRRDQAQQQREFSARLGPSAVGMEMQTVHCFSRDCRQPILTSNMGECHRFAALTAKN